MSISDTFGTLELQVVNFPKKKDMSKVEGT